MNVYGRTQNETREEVEIFTEHSGHCDLSYDMET